MHNSAQRFVLAALLLVGVWIVTYWAWPAPSVADDAGITFDSGSAFVPTGVSPAPLAGAPDTPAPAAPVEQVRPAPPEPAPAQPAAPVAAAETRAPAVEPPQFRAYVVRQGDNPWIIAERLYGDPQRWEAIAKANPLVDVNRLRVGQTLRIPVDPGNIQGRVTAGAGAPAPARPTEPDVTEYTVTKNDTLSGIAKRFYGSSADWKTIFEANRSVISAPEDIRPGMKLRIPPAPRAATR